MTIVVYNTLGEEVRKLINEKKQAGEYSIEFNAENLPNGIYIYKIMIINFTIVIRVGGRIERFL